MRIGDAAAAAGTTPRLLRFYEQNGLLASPQRSSAGQRVYGPRDKVRA
jgi:MerR family transcriptional regulator, copper efflux regulator